LEITHILALRQQENEKIWGKFKKFLLKFHCFCVFWGRFEAFIVWELSQTIVE
jgi:hypothetical protein